VAGRDDGAVMFVVESGAAEINQSHVRPFHSPVIPFLFSSQGETHTHIERKKERNCIKFNNNNPSEKKKESPSGPIEKQRNDPMK
jgi:hypothetical protein